MKRKISRRKFVIGTMAATTASARMQTLAVYMAQERPHLLESDLSSAIAGRYINVARNRLAYQSSAIDDDHTAHLVTDGSSSTYWECKPEGEQWISVDLGKVMQIDRVVLHWGTKFARHYTIEASSDGKVPVRWRTIFATSSGLGGVEEQPFGSVSARHIRLTGAADQGFSVSELEAWSKQTASVHHARPSMLVEKDALLTEGWYLQCARFAKNTAAEISSSKFSQTDWLKASVPGTVLTNYVKAEAIPDLFYGNQQSQISEDFFTCNDFWYRNTFFISSSCSGRRLWLVFDGINWKADVYLNGIRLGNTEGAFIRSRFDITEAASCGGMNCVAVLVHRVSHPGNVHHSHLGGKTNNGGVLGLDSPTFLASIGWNWIPTIRGRNIGIWNKVHFKNTGDIVLEDSLVTCELNSPENTRANLTVRFFLRNSANHAKQGTLTIALAKNIFHKTISLQPGESINITLDKTDWEALTLDHPSPWWPNGYGDQHLYQMDFRVTCDGKPSDSRTINFGVRQAEYREENGILHIFINGQRILCRGGNWGMDHGMLDCDADGYDMRVRMHRDMNLVMIRNWVGMVGKDDFYDACDRYGLLIWDDFWLANPADGNEPSDNAMFIKNVRDKIRRVRHHPSVILYCGRNEGDPPADLDRAMRDAVSELDGTRYYLSDSASGVVTGRGPYENKDPEWYFENRGLTLHSEQGIVCIPPVESMRAMMPEKNLWPINDMWAIHDYQSPRSVQNTRRIEQRYGTASGIEDYCRKAQMVNLESAKAMYECLQSRQGSGLLVWMTQSAWPSLVCQLYDYYFEQTAAYFGAKTGCEPLHVLWDQHTNFVKVANNTAVEAKGLRVAARIYDLNGVERWQTSTELNVPPTHALECFPLKSESDIQGIFFIKLILSRTGIAVSENFYWSPATKGGNCRDLDKLLPVKLQTAAWIGTTGNERSITIRVKNPASTIALAVRLKVIQGPLGDRVLPLLYEDNYFSLCPSESKTVVVKIPKSTLIVGLLRLVIDGWNIVHNEISIE